MAEAVQAKLSLICPLGQRRLRDPVVGDRCRHQQAFDRATFIAYVATLRHPRASRCPVCLAPAAVATLRPSPLYKLALTKAAPTALWAELESSELLQLGVKEEGSEDEAENETNTVVTTGTAQQSHGLLRRLLRSSTRLHRNHNTSNTGLNTRASPRDSERASMAATACLARQSRDTFQRNVAAQIANFLAPGAPPLPAILIPASDSAERHIVHEAAEEHGLTSVALALGSGEDCDSRPVICYRPGCEPSEAELAVLKYGGQDGDSGTNTTCMASINTVHSSSAASDPMPARAASTSSVPCSDLSGMAQAMDFAIFTAFRTGSFGGIRTLIARGADANTRRTAADGGTALIAAAFHGRLRECEWLLDMGSDPSVRDNAGNNAASVAEARCHHQVAKILMQAQHEQRCHQPTTNAEPRDQNARKPHTSSKIVRDYQDTTKGNHGRAKRSSGSTWDQPSPASAPPTKMLVSLGRKKRDRRTVEEIQRHLKAKKGRR